MSIDGSDSPSNTKFTSIKLRWMTSVMSAALTSIDKCVAFIIMNAINEKTRDWKLSDETIAALLGNTVSISSVKRARKRLRDAGWIGWKRTRDANVYFLCHENVWAAMDEIMKGRMARRERRNEKTRVIGGTMPSATGDTQTYSKDIHDKRISRSHTRERRELRLMRVVSGGRS
jgi:hypothetical protein